MPIIEHKLIGKHEERS